MQTSSPPYYPARRYPLTFTVDYPDRPLNRLSTGLRFLWILPIMVILWLLESGTIPGHSSEWQAPLAGVGLLSLPVLLMILFRRKYPRWWFDWNREFSRFGARVASYGALLRDEYPSTDEEQAVHLDFAYPDATTLSRGLPIVKWLLAIPHYIVLWFLWIAACVCIIIAWFAILFTGRYPRGLFDFVVGVMRWTLRVTAYSILLITDEYPPFSLSE
jgi:hypothetical protein